MSAVLEVSESARLTALRSFQVLDAPPPLAFDNIVQVASLLCASPIALISLVDSERLFFMAHAGLDVRQVPRKGSLCECAIILPDELLEVEDTTKDARFASSELVTGFPGIRFYAGVPLVTSEGTALGTLCVIDRKPRVLTESQRTGLYYLAQLTVELLESRRRELRHT